MPSLLHQDLGRGPVVVLLHGVGIGPRSFATLATLLGDGHRVLVVERARREGGRALPLREQVDQLADLLDEVDGVGGRLVGVSGGATLGLLAAMHRPELFTSYVLHEPLVGRLVPELHDRFAAAAARAAEGLAETMDVVRAVMGERTWEAIGPDGRSYAIAAVRRWQGEVAEFAAFDPSAAELAALGATPILATVGERSDPLRFQAIDVLVHLARARSAVVAGAGNVPQVDAPEAFASVVTAFSPKLTEVAP